MLLPLTASNPSWAIGPCCLMGERITASLKPNRVVVVVPGDTLLVLAERHLGASDPLPVGSWLFILRRRTTTSGTSASVTAVGTALAAAAHSARASSDQDGMVDLPRRVGQGGFQVIRFQIREVSQDLLAALPGGIELKDVLHADPHAADARPAAALVGVVGDTAGHGSKLSASAG